MSQLEELSFKNENEKDISSICSIDNNQSFEQSESNKNYRISANDLNINELHTLLQF